jgi:hypothetical protein
MMKNKRRLKEDYESDTEMTSFILLPIHPHQILLQAGANLKIRETKENKTAYELALALKQDEIAKILRAVHDLYVWAKKVMNTQSEEAGR